MGWQQKDITKMKIMPIGTINLMTSAGGPLRFGEFGGNNYPESVLGSNSQWAFEPILRDNDRGGQTPAAYKFTGEFEVLVNDYWNYWTDLKDKMKAKITDFDLQLYAPSGQSGGDNMYISADSTINVKEWHATVKFSQSGLYPKLTIYVKGLFSVDVLDMAYSFFSNS